MPWTRASELHRAVRCPASTVLPRGPERDTGATTFGRQVHAHVAGAEPTPAVREWLGRVGKVAYKALWGHGVPDVLMAASCLNDEVRMFTGLDKPERDFIRAALTSEFVVGEADLVMETPVPHVVDLKTGWHPGNPADLEQLLFYGFVVMQYAGADSVFLSIDHWPADGAQPPLRVTEVVGRGQLTAWWNERVVPAARLAMGPNPPAVPGEHCRFCPCHTCLHNYEANEGAT